MQQAHQIEDLINESAGTHDLNDSDFDDAGADSESHSHITVSSDVEDDPQQTPSQPHLPKVTITKATRGQPTHRSRPSVDLIHNLSQAIDPQTQRQQDADCANRSLQNTQILSMTQQLHDAQQQTETICSQLNDIQQCLNESEHARDHAELRLEVMQLSGANQASG